MPACSCGGIPGRTPWDTAEKEARWAKAIFEGRPVRFAVDWNILNARPGDLVGAGFQASEKLNDSQPRMVITWQVKRVYKGRLGAKVQVRTGMGGGDCGEQYAVGLDYLVYAFEASTGELVVNMCSPGGWLGSNYLITELRYLRKDRPLPSDLAPSERWTPAAVAGRNREREEFTRRYAAATGQICGVVSPVPDGESERVAFLPVAGSSPLGRSSAEVRRDGRFCSDRLGPGEYYVYLAGGPWSGDLERSVYYPDVTDREQAAIVQVRTGQVRSDLVFHVHTQTSYTVRGLISIDDKSRMGDDVTFVLLVDPDGKIWRRQAVDFRGLFPLPRIKYFSFEDVPPGRYIACALTSNQDLFTRVASVNVTNHSKLVWLELRHREP